LGQGEGLGRWEGGDASGEEYLRDRFLTRDNEEWDKVCVGDGASAVLGAVVSDSEDGACKVGEQGVVMLGKG